MSHGATDTNQLRSEIADVAVSEVHNPQTRQLLGLLVTIVMVLVTPRMGHAQGDKPAGPYRVAPIVLAVGAADGKQFPQSRDVSIPLNLKGLSDFLTPDGLNWAPADALKTFDVKLRLPERLQPNRLRVGQPGDPEIDISVAFASDRIKEGQPVKLKFKIERPEKIPTGVSAGDFRVRFWDPKLEPKAGFELIFPVVIYGFGRVLEDVQFLEPTVRVGAPASVSINVLSIGRDLGSGHLRLTHQPLAGDPSEAVRVPLPLADGDLIIPRYDPRFGPAADVPAPDDEAVVEATPDQPAEWWAHPAWRDDSIWQRRTPELIADADLAIPLNLVQRHRLELHLPDSFSLGTWKGEIDWDSGRETDGGPAERIHQTITAKIGSGLKVSHRVGWVGDRLAFRVVAARPYGDRTTVEITYPDQQTKAKIPLTLRVPKGEAKGQAGELSTYQGLFPERGSTGRKLDQMGGYSARILDLDGDAEDSMRLPTTFRICFQLDTRELQNNPELTVFASPVPLDVYLWQTPHSGKAWKTPHNAAFKIAFDGGQLLKSQVRRMLPLYRVAQLDRRATRQLIANRQQEIDVLVTPSGVAGDWEVLELPPKSSQSWDISASISPKDAPDAQRRQLGVRHFEQPILLVGQDAAGNYFTRVWWLPLTVRIDRDWEHHKYFVFLFAVLGSFAVVGLSVWIKSRFGSRRQIPLDQTGISIPANDDFFGDSANPSPSPTASSRLEPPVQTPTPPTKSDGDWFNS